MAVRLYEERSKTLDMVVKGSKKCQYLPAPLWKMVKAFAADHYAEFIVRCASRITMLTLQQREWIYQLARAFRDRKVSASAETLQSRGTASAEPLMPEIAAFGLLDICSNNGKDQHGKTTAMLLWAAIEIQYVSQLRILFISKHVNARSNLFRLAMENVRHRLVLLNAERCVVKPELPLTQKHEHSSCIFIPPAKALNHGLMEIDIDICILDDLQGMIPSDLKTLLPWKTFVCYSTVSADAETARHGTKRKAI